NGLQAFVRPPALRLLDQQELVIGRLLNLDEVRHLCDFLYFAEKLANPFATGKRFCHRGLSLPASRIGGGGFRRCPVGGAPEDASRRTSRTRRPLRPPSKLAT